MRAGRRLVARPARGRGYGQPDVPAAAASGTSDLSGGSGSERRRSYMMAIPPWSATAGGASPVECDRRGNRVRKEPSYVRSRHRRRRAHADRARVQGVAQGLPGRRAGRRAAQGARRAQPRGRLRPDRRRDDGRRVELRRAGLQRRAQRDAGWPASTITCPRARSTASAPRRCRRCAWPSTPSRRARATSTSPRASSPSRAPAWARAWPTSSRTTSSTARRARSSTSTSRWG